MRRAIVLLLFVVALLVRYSGSRGRRTVGPPTSIGTGGAAASVETLATPGGDRHAESRRQRDRRGRRGGGRARRDRAVLLRPRRRRLHGHPPRARQGDHDRRARDRARGDDADGVHRPRDRPAAAVQRRALERPVRRRPRDARDLGPRAEEVRDDEAQGRAEGRASTSPGTGSSSTRRSSTRRRARSTGSTTSRRRRRSTSIRTARRTTSARRSATPTSRTRTS